MSALAGKRIVITRALHQAGEFERLLRERGAVPLLYPCIDIAPPENTQALDVALQNAGGGAFDWLVLTSSNTVQAIARRLDVLGSSVSSVQVAAVGTATAEAARQLLGLRVKVIPDVYTAEALAEAMQPVSGMRVLLPQSAIADDTLERALVDAGAQVTIVTAYRTVIGSSGVDLPALLAAGEVDVITFTSPSTVENLLLRLNADAELDVCIACIGTTTASAARERGFTVSVVPDEHTLQGLTTALEQYFGAVEAGVIQDVDHQRSL